MIKNKRLNNQYLRLIMVLILATVLISCSQTKQLPVLKTTTKSISIKEGKNLHQDVWTVSPELTLGNFELQNISVDINDKNPEGVEDNEILGNTLLQQFNAVIDLQNNQIYLRPNHFF